MVQLAERRHGVLTIGAALALTTVASLRTGGSPVALPPPSVTVAVPEPKVADVPGAKCPAFVDAYLETTAVRQYDVRCIPGRFPAPGFFVHVTYVTTEPWERYGIIAADGEVIVPMEDRPVLRPFVYQAIDLDGDGVDELVGTATACASLDVNVLTVQGAHLLSSSSLAIRDDHREVGCHTPVMWIVDREIHISYGNGARATKYYFLNGLLTKHYDVDW